MHLAVFFSKIWIVDLPLNIVKGFVQMKKHQDNGDYSKCDMNNKDRIINKIPDAFRTMEFGFITNKEPDDIKGQKQCIDNNSQEH